jgi:tRNA-2-methylthio-N6-dimethylallyladenosine synthase
VRPGTPATRLDDDVAPAVKRRRLNELLELQEEIGRERNEAWVGAEVSVLVDAIAKPRGHAHDDGPADGLTDGATGQVSGRTRGNKLVHLSGGAELVGREVLARIDRAGPYALRGSVIEGSVAG